jgi:hypothetical protein
MAVCVAIFLLLWGGDKMLELSINDTKMEILIFEASYKIEDLE